MTKKRNLMKSDLVIVNLIIFTLILKNESEHLGKNKYYKALRNKNCINLKPIHIFF